MTPNKGSEILKKIISKFMSFVGKSEAKKD